MSGCQIKRGVTFLGTIKLLRTLQFSLVSLILYTPCSISSPNGGVMKIRFFIFSFLCLLNFKGVQAQDYLGSLSKVVVYLNDGTSKDMSIAELSIMGFPQKFIGETQNFLTKIAMQPGFEKIMHWGETQEAFWQDVLKETYTLRPHGITSFCLNEVFTCPSPGGNISPRGLKWLQVIRSILNPIYLEAVEEDDNQSSSTKTMARVFGSDSQSTQFIIYDVTPILSKGLNVLRSAWSCPMGISPSLENREAKRCQPMNFSESPAGHQVSGYSYALRISENL